jgi:hypothetical protein
LVFLFVCEADFELPPRPSAAVGGGGSGLANKQIIRHPLPRKDRSGGFCIVQGFNRSRNKNLQKDVVLWLPV